MALARHPYAPAALARHTTDANWRSEDHAWLMTFIWFVVWLIANNVGAHEPLLLNPVNAWTATLILAVALDMGANHARGRGSA
jgi:hypothetical protein